MSARDAAETARAELTGAVAVSQQLLDEHGRHPAFRTSAEWLIALIAHSLAVNTAAREYLTATSGGLPARDVRGSRNGGASGPGPGGTASSPPVPTTRKESRP
jgi:hypothetical protein